MEAGRIPPERVEGRTGPRARRPPEEDDQLTGVNRVTKFPKAEEHMQDYFRRFVYVRRNGFCGGEVSQAVFSQGPAATVVRRARAHLQRAFETRTPAIRSSIRSGI